MAFTSTSLLIEGFNLRFVDIRIIANRTRGGMRSGMLILP